MPSAISSTSNKSAKRDKEYLVNLEKKIDGITKGLEKAWSKNLREGLPLENAKVICNYIISMRTEINPSSLCLLNLGLISSCCVVLLSGISV